EWLFQLWPDDSGLDAMAGPPRRIAGALPFAFRPTSWSAGLRELQERGWSFPGEAFREILQSIAAAGAPFLPDELPATWGPWGLQRERAGGYTWDSPAIGHGWAVDPEQIRERDR